jgi:hypothetical protein
LDDFWDRRDSVYVNGFSVSKTPYAQKMSTSAVELGILDDFWVPDTEFSSTVFDIAEVYML